MKPPQGRAGRPSKSFTLDQAKALLAAAENTRLHAYVVLALLLGIRTEEARALRWDHVVTWVWQAVTGTGFELPMAGEDRYAIYVWRSERHGGDTKTGKSRRTLALPRRCVQALRQHMEQQAKERLTAGDLWPEPGLVFASTVGTRDAAHLRVRPVRQRRAGREHHLAYRTRPHGHD